MIREKGKREREGSGEGGEREGGEKREGRGSLNTLDFLRFLLPTTRCD